MCVIIHRPAEGHDLDLAHLRQAFNMNSDGWGIMYAEGGRVVTSRGMLWHEFVEAYDAAGTRELGIHFRIKTHGNIDLRNTHPYQVLSAEEHGRDLWLMHNGVIRIAQSDPTLSDTWHFAVDEMRPILLEAPNLLGNPVFGRLLEERIGWSKLLFLDGDGVFTTVARHKGKEMRGCWFSNDNHVPVARVGYHNWSGGYVSAGTAVGGVGEAQKALPFAPAGASAGSSAGSSASSGSASTRKAEPAVFAGPSPAMKRIILDDFDRTWIRRGDSPEDAHHILNLAAQLTDEGYETHEIFDRLEEERERLAIAAEESIDADVIGSIPLLDRISDAGEVDIDDLRALDYADIVKLCKAEPEIVTDFITSLLEWFEEEREETAAN